MDSDREHGMDRRAFLRKAAVSGAAAAWAVPLVRTVAATPAYAQANGSPPPRGTEGGPNPGPADTKPATTTTTTTTTTPAGTVVTNPGVTSPANLPQNIPISGGPPAQVLGETLTRGGSAPGVIGGGALGAGVGLAFTGSPLAALAGLGVGFLAAGGVMRIVARFRAETDA